MGGPTNGLVVVVVLQDSIERFVYVSSRGYLTVIIGRCGEEEEEQQIESN